MSDEIGRAKIIVEADTEGVSASISDAKTEVESLGDAGQVAGEKIETSFTSVGEAIENKTAGVRKFAGALSSVAGVATGLIGVFGLLTGAVAGFISILKKLNDDNSDEGIKKTTANLQELFDTASGQSAAVGAVPVFEALTRQIDDLDEKVQNAKLRGLDTLIDGKVILRIEDATEKLNRLREKREKFREIARGTNVSDELGVGDEAVERAEQYRKSLESIQQQAEAIRRSLIIDPLERVESEQEAAMQAAENMLDTIGARHSEQGKQLLDAIRERGEAEREEIKKTILDRINAEEKAIAERERREKEAAERSAKAAADAFERAMAPLIASLTSSFGTGFTTQLGAITNKIDEAVDELKKVKRGR